MTRTRPVSRGRQAVLPVLALLLVAAGATVVYSALALQDIEEGCVRTETIRRTTRTRMRLLRSRGGVPRRGELIAAPSTSAEVRAMVAFCDTARPGDAAALREVALRTGDSLGASNAVRALGRLRAVAADPELPALVHDPRERVRHETILALGGSGDAPVAATLVPLTRDADPKVRLAALHALGRIGGPVARDVARDVLASPSASREEKAFARNVPGVAAR
jgi:HEAT repeats